MKHMGKQPTRRDLLDIAMDMVDDQTGVGMDDEQLRAQVFTFLFAGHETTGVSMSWTLYELAKRPEIQEKIRKEANEVLGDGRLLFVSSFSIKKFLFLCLYLFYIVLQCDCSYGAILYYLASEIWVEEKTPLGTGGGGRGAGIDLDGATISAQKI